MNIATFDIEPKGGHLYYKSRDTISYYLGCVIFGYRKLNFDS